MLGSAVFCMIDKISIHALREEGDVKLLEQCASLKLFLSTPSARRATVGDPHRLYRAGISIHALREEGDAGCRACRNRRGQISIHALREEGDYG